VPYAHDARARECFETSNDCRRSKNVGELSLVPNRGASDTVSHKILLYKLLLRSMITYAAPVWSTSQTNYRHLQVYQSKCLRVIGDFPRCTPISNLHAHLQMIPIRQVICHLTDKFFVSCPGHPNPLIHNIGNYTLEQGRIKLFGAPRQ